MSEGSFGAALGTPTGMGFGAPLEKPPTGMDALAAIEFTGPNTANGRLMLVRPSTIQHGIKGDTGTYSVIHCTVVFLDGPVNAAVETVPLRVDQFRLSGGYLIPLITPRFNIADVPLMNSGRANEFTMTPKDPSNPWVLGRAKKVANKKNTGSWDLAPFTPADAQLAMAWLAANPDTVKNPWSS